MNAALEKSQSAADMLKFKKRQAESTMLSSAKHKAEEAEIAALLKKKGNLNPAEKSTVSGGVNAIKLPLEKSPLERDNGYVMTFIIQQIEWMRD